MTFLIQNKLGQNLPSPSKVGTKFLVFSFYHKYMFD